MTHLQSPPAWKSLPVHVAIFLLGSIGALLALRVVPPAQDDLGPATIEVSGEFGTARTTVSVPPLGAVSAETHSAPLSLTMAIVGVDPEALGRALGGDASREALERALEEDLRGAALRLAIQLFVGALVVGAVLAGILPHRHISTIIAGSLGGAVAAALVLGFTATSFDVGAFREPRFSGTLERAPQVIAAVDRGVESFEALKSRYANGAERLSELLTLVAEPTRRNPSDNSTAILHISDLHSNPLGVEVADRLALEFGVDAIVDTGDMTSFGAPIESLIGNLIPDIDVPYLFVPGNHDSPVNRRALSSIPAISILDGTSEEVAGIDVLGWADPTFTASNEITTGEGNLRRLVVADRVAEAVMETQPDVLAVHDVRLAARAFGEVPLVLAGHAHEASFEEVDGTVVMVVGSAGATGLGSFIVEAERPYEAEIIYLRDGRPIAYDYVRLSGLGGDFEIQRRTLEEAPES